MLDDAIKGGGGLGQMEGAGVAARDLAHRVSGVERARRLDDGRCGLVAAARPRLDIDRACIELL
jgi:hypothetical protein